MISALHTIADTVIKRIHRSPFYYKRYNNTLSYRINKAYIDYTRECSARFAAQHPGQMFGPSPLEEDGQPVLLRNVYPAEKARALSAQITQMIETNHPHAIRPAKQFGGGIVQIERPLEVFGTDTLGVLSSPEVEKALLQFFRGYYRVRGVTVWRTLPTTEANKSSWLWHSDSFPPYTCKFFLHLTPVTGATGATEFMNREDTMAYRRAGYFGQFGHERRGDLDVFAKEHGLPYRPFHVDAEPGDATIFNMNFFHRAVPPRDRFRDVVQFLLLPSAVPWHEYLREDLARLTKAGGDFPKDPRPEAVTSSQAMA